MASRILLRVTLRARKSRARFLAAVKNYANEPTARTWVVARRTRTDFVLRHKSRRADDTAFRFSKSAETTREVRVRVTGAEPRLAVAYVVTLLASERFADYVESIEIDLA